MDYYRDRLRTKEEQLRIANDLVEFKNECLQRLNKKIDRLEKEEEELSTAYDLIERKNSCLQRQNEKLEELRRENEELKLKAEKYYDLWQAELMENDDYEDN